MPEIRFFKRPVKDAVFPQAKGQPGPVQRAGHFRVLAQPADPLSQQVSLWMNKPGVTSIAWTFNAIPSEEWKNKFGAGLLMYCEGMSSWDEVVQNAVADWTSEWNIKNAR